MAKAKPKYIKQKHQLKHSVHASIDIYALRILQRIEKETGAKRSTIINETIKFAGTKVYGQRKNVVTPLLKLVKTCYLKQKRKKRK